MVTQKFQQFEVICILFLAYKIHFSQGGSPKIYQFGKWIWVLFFNHSLILFKLIHTFDLFTKTNTRSYWRFTYFGISWCKLVSILTLFITHRASEACNFWHLSAKILYTVEPKTATSPCVHFEVKKERRTSQLFLFQLF